MAIDGTNCTLIFHEHCGTSLGIPISHANEMSCSLPGWVAKVVLERNFCAPQACACEIGTILGGLVLLIDLCSKASRQWHLRRNSSKKPFETGEVHARLILIY